jgi:hypothetical protein
MKPRPEALSRLASAVIRQAVEDLDSEDAELRKEAEKFFFDEEQTGPLSFENWLLFCGCLDADAERALLRIKLERRKKKAA